VEAAAEVVALEGIELHHKGLRNHKLLIQQWPMRSRN
jgi:hypothetical protein